jgi:hypothetical protein
MFKIGAVYFLLMLSLAFPPLLLISIPLAVWGTMSVVNKRAKTVDLAHRVAAQQRHDQVVRYFR